MVKSVTNGKEVLDIGAGTGHFLNQITKAGLNGKGLEPDADARAFAKSNFNIDLQPIQDLYQLKEDSVDVITMWHVLEHVYHLQNDFDMPSYFLADVFVNIKIKTVRLFLKYAYINQKTGKGYFASPYYPGQPKGFDLGLSWMFYD